MKRIGDYEIVKKISEGSFGETFLGRHVFTGLPVCIKQEITGESPGTEMFRQEAMALWGLHHESIVKVMNYIEVPLGGEIYQFIVMNYVEGPTLGDLVEKLGPVDDEHICWIMQSSLDALSYLHYWKVIHCDLKPENIKVQLDEHNVVLLDFGLVAAGAHADRGAPGGTEGYLPPEFPLGMPPLPESDLWALGKVALFLAGGDSAVEAGVPPADMKEEVAKVISKMLRRNPLARYRTATECHAAFCESRRAAFGRAATRDEEVLKLRDGRTFGLGEVKL